MASWWDSKEDSGSISAWSVSAWSVSLELSLGGVGGGGGVPGSLPSPGSSPFSLTGADCSRWIRALRCRRAISSTAVLELEERELARLEPELELELELVGAGAGSGRTFTGTGAGSPTIFPPGQARCCQGGCGTGVSPQQPSQVLRALRPAEAATSQPEARPNLSSLVSLPGLPLLDLLPCAWLLGKKASEREYCTVEFTLNYT